LAAGGVTEADLLVAARAAQVGARVLEALRDTRLKPAALAVLSRLEMDLLRNLGLSRLARRGLPTPEPEQKKSHLDQFTDDDES
jgi:hypothetical protein